MRSGQFEPAETALLSRLLPQADVFIDVGANLGTYSLFAALHGQDVLAYEPDPVNAHHMSQSVVVNKVSERVVISRDLVSDRDGHQEKLCPFPGLRFARVDPCAHLHSVHVTRARRNP